MLVSLSCLSSPAVKFAADVVLEPEFHELTGLAEARNFGRATWVTLRDVAGSAVLATGLLIGAGGVNVD